MVDKWYRDEYGELNGWGFVTLFSLGLILFSLVFVVFIGFVERAECGGRADEMGRAWRWGYFSGCVVQMNDGSWVPLDNLRIFEE